MTDEQHTVLVVDDEAEIADLYAVWLGDRYETRTAYDGAEALERVDESVDVVCLDRRMPELSGDEVLAEMHERGLDCRTVLVTAVDPDFDIIDLPLDQYLTKPVTRSDLEDTVAELCRRATYDRPLTEFRALVSKKAVLESEKTPSELGNSERYQQMIERAEALAEATDRSVPEPDDGFLFREFSDG